MSQIHFYSTRGPYGAFSNFSRHAVSLGGKRWPTSEHYFQAMKFEGTAHEEEVRRAKTPGEAARLGRDRKRPLRRDWESVKDEVMRQVIRAKFTQHAELTELLLGTGTEELVEASPVDGYWGYGPDGKGRNMLGRILMQVREELLRAGA